VIASKTGANPYKDGAVGSGDLHSGAPGADRFGRPFADL